MGGDLLFSLEFIIVKELQKFKVEGVTSGTFYVFFVGIIGSFSLTIYSLSGGMENENFN